MRDEAVAAVRAGNPPLPLSAEDVEPEFRVVVRGGNRRGVRLERFFWNTLKQFTQSRKSTLGQMVEDISHVAPETGNLTSAIRVACTRWLTEENAELKKLASLRKVNTLLLACPSPAFTLSSSKKILAFNPAFQLLVRRQLPMEQGNQGRLDLKLALDLSVADIFARLAADSDRPVMTGFVIGAADRRHRGQLNVVRAPVSEAEVLLAFVSGG